MEEGEGGLRNGSQGEKGMVDGGGVGGWTDWKWRNMEHCEIV